MRVLISVYVHGITEKPTPHTRTRMRMLGIAWVYAHATHAFVTSTLYYSAPCLELLHAYVHECVTVDVNRRPPLLDICGE